MPEERVVLVTGGTGGLGSVVSLLFARAGWTVALTDLEPETLAHHTQRLLQGADPQTVIGRKADVTEPAQAAALVAQILAHHGRLDALVNTVGGYTSGSAVGDLPDLGVWHRMWQLNVLSAVVMCRAAIPAMRTRGWGRIVNVSARAGLRSAPKAAAYSAAKAALISLTEAIAAEEAPHGITANAILPGTIDTADNRQAMPNADYTRWVQPAQIGEAMLYLCSEPAQAITGAKIEIYGRS